MTVNPRTVITRALVLVGRGEGMIRQCDEAEGAWSMDAAWAQPLLYILRELLTLPGPEKWDPVSPALWDV